MTLLKVAFKFLGTAEISLLMAIAPAAATTVSAGATHSCSVSNAGASSCWGSLTTSLASRDAIDVRAGRDFSCALLKSGSVSCWGKNDLFQLGTASGDPVGQQVAGLTGAVQIAAGDTHACALTSAGDVYCWGDGSSGQLGEPARAVSATAVRVAGLSNAANVSAGKGSTCAVLKDGTAACLGSGSQLAGADSEPRTPKILPGFNDVTGISTYESHGCLVRTGGQVACWGSNTNGQLGSAASNAAISAPVDVAGIGGAAQAVSVGKGYSCAVLNSGAISCWGANDKGQLGTGYPLSASQAPRQVVGITNARTVSTGAEHACAVLDGDFVNCWGAPGNDRLGIDACYTTGAEYPGFAYQKGPIFNNGACLASATGAITPYAVRNLGPNNDMALVLNWAGRTMPSVFPGSFFPEFFTYVPNFFLADYKNRRYLAITANGTPKLVFMGPESADTIIDLGPLSDWAREARK